MLEIVAHLPRGARPGPKGHGYTIHFQRTLDKNADELWVPQREVRPEMDAICDGEVERVPVFDVDHATGNHVEVGTLITYGVARNAQNCHEADRERQYLQHLQQIEIPVPEVARRDMAFHDAITHLVFPFYEFQRYKTDLEAIINARFVSGLPNLKKISLVLNQVWKRPLKPPSAQYLVLGEGMSNLAANDPDGSKGPGRGSGRAASRVQYRSVE